MLKSILVDYNPVARVSNYIFNTSSLLSKIANHIKDLLFNKDDETLRNLLFLTGIAALTYKTGQLLR